MSIPKSDTLMPNASNNPVKFNTLEFKLEKSPVVNSLARSMLETFTPDKSILERSIALRSKELSY